MKNYKIIEVKTGLTVAPIMALYTNEIKAIEAAGFYCIRL